MYLSPKLVFVTHLLLFIFLYVLLLRCTQGKKLSKVLLSIVAIIFLLGIAYHAWRAFDKYKSTPWFSESMGNSGGNSCPGWKDIVKLWPEEAKNCGMKQIMDLWNYEVVKKNIDGIIARVKVDMPLGKPWEKDHKNTKMLEDWKKCGMPK